MARIFKRVQGLYSLTAKNVAADIFGDASATTSEATSSQSQGPYLLVTIRTEWVAISST
ncbi:hypothetical protein Dimus_001110 [Dionaea muscipula]